MLARTLLPASWSLLYCVNISFRISNVIKQINKWIIFCALSSVMQHVSCIDALLEFMVVFENVNAFIWCHRYLTAQMERS